MDYPLVSFVVITHDRPFPLIKQRIIKSIAGQTYPNIEIILIGEDRPDINKLADEVKKEFGLSQVRSKNVTRKTEKTELCIWAKVARCRNAGIAMAKGEYIACQDDDNELESDFTSSLVETITKAHAEAAWCYRRAVLPDGSPFPGTFFPWMIDDPIRRRILYRIWKDAGIFVPGSAIIRDQLTATYKNEDFSTVDPNEWLVKKSLYTRIPFTEDYDFLSISYHYTFDDLWNIAVRKAKIKTACSKKPSLIYFLGGLTNSLPGPDELYAS